MRRDLLISSKQYYTFQPSEHGPREKIEADVYIYIVYDLEKLTSQGARWQTAKGV